jgi:toxin YoeB
VRLAFTPRAWIQYQHWLEADIETFRRLNILIRECQRTPFAGLGKPEPLKNEFKGYWSRRITLEHRLVYRVTGSGDAQTLEIVQCRFHY